MVEQFGRQVYGLLELESLRQAPARNRTTCGGASGIKRFLPSLTTAPATILVGRAFRASALRGVHHGRAGHLVVERIALHSDLNAEKNEGLSQSL